MLKENHMIKLTYSISIFYITLCLPAQLFTALSKPTIQKATQDKKRLNAEFKQSILDIQALETAIIAQDHVQFDQIISQNPGIVSYKNPQENSDSILHLAARIGNTHAVQKLLDFNFNPKRTNKLGQTALHVAYHFDLDLKSNYEPEIIKLLVEKDKSLLNQVDVFHATALHYAVVRNNPQAVQKLISFSPKFDIQDRITLTPLEYAAKNFKPYKRPFNPIIDSYEDFEEYNQNIEIIKMLTKQDPGLAQETKDALLDILENQQSFIPTKHYPIQRKLEKYLFNSVEQENSALLYLVLTLIDHPNIYDELSETPLIKAYKENKFKAFKILASNKADINVLHRCKTLLTWASKDGYLNWVHELLNQNANPNWYDLNGRTALMFAIEHNQLNIVTLLLTANADPDIKSNCGTTALMLASQNNYLDMVKALHTKNATLNLQDSYGKTALMRASENGCLDVVKELLIENADPHICNTNKKTALDLAKDKLSNYIQIIRILETCLHANATDYNTSTILFEPEITLIEASRNGDLNGVTNLLRNNINPYRQSKICQIALDFAKNKPLIYQEIITILEKVTNKEPNNSDSSCAVQ